ncbi:ANKRD50 [Symbiodinium sp. CCMP2592]|nr:ANKRD50 [Symbiodinium sp. CCMP2592]
MGCCHSQLETKTPEAGPTLLQARRRVEGLPSCRPPAKSELEECLQDPDFVLERCDLDGSGTLDEHELKQAFAAFGLKPSAERLRQSMAGLNEIDKPTFRDLVSKLQEELPSDMRCRRAVPHSLRGMSLQQLQMLEELYLRSGWLQRQCDTYNQQHAAEIASEQPGFFKQGPNLYAVDVYIVTPLSKPAQAGECPARRHDRRNRIPKARAQSSFSELLNPHGCRVHFFVSHFWGHLFQTTMAALTAWADAQGELMNVAASMDIVYWICLFAVNQHNAAEEVGDVPMRGPFNAALSQAKGGAVMVLDQNAEPFKRIWCLFEVHRLHKLDCPFELITEWGSLSSVAQTASSTGPQALENMLETTAEAIWASSALTARASVVEDKHRIWHAICDETLRNMPLQEMLREHNSIQEMSSLSGNPSGCVRHFGDFDSRVHGILATPLLEISIQSGNWGQAIRCIAQGARFGREQLWALRRLMLQEHQAQASSSQNVVACILELQSFWLHVAANSNYVAEAALLLQEGADVNYAESEHGLTPLLYSAQHGSVEMVNLLLSARANINQRNNHRCTPLMLAAKSGHCSLVQLLWEASASVVPADIWGKTALREAVMRGHDSVVRLLLPAAIGRDRLPILLGVAACKGNASVVRTLLEACAAVNYRNPKVDGNTGLIYAAEGGFASVCSMLLDGRADIALGNAQGRTPLMQAAAKGHLSTIRLLLDRRAEIAQTDACRQTCMTYALHHGQDAVAALLIDAGADPTSSANLLAPPSNFEAQFIITQLLLSMAMQLLPFDRFAVEREARWGFTCLIAAAIQGEQGLAIALLEHAANVEIAAYDGQTPLIHAVNQGRSEFVQLLLQANANTATPDCKGVTPLMAACEIGNSEVAGLLLEARADVQAIDMKGETALHLASRKGWQAVVELLVSASADLEATDDESAFTSLMMAASGGQLATVQTLIDSGASVNRADSEKWTALMMAATGGHTQVVETLLRARASVCAQNIHGVAALALATHHPATSEVLLAAQADVNSSSYVDGETPLMNAVERGCERTARLLVEARADVAQANKCGRTALGYATDDQIRALLEAQLNDDLYFSI